MGDAVSASYLDLNAYAGASFGTQTPVSVPYADARSFCASVSEVIFTDGSSWSADGEWKPLPEATSLSEKLGEDELVKQYRIIKENAKYLPMTAEDLWFCDCGCWNPNGESYCYGCNKERYRFEDIDLDTLKKDKDARVTKETATRKKTAKITAIAASALVVLILTVSLISSYTEKLGIYKEAVSLREEPTSEYSFDDAVEKFESLENFKDSPEQIEITKKAKEEYILSEMYNDAVGSYEDGVYDLAIEYLEELGDYKDSKELLEKVKAAQTEDNYQKALEYMEKGWYDSAIDILEDMGDYKDTAEKLAECELCEAIKDLDENYFINNNQSYTRVKSGELVGAVKGEKYLVEMEGYSWNSEVIKLTFNADGTVDCDTDFRTRSWGINQDNMLYGSMGRDSLMNKKDSSSYNYHLYKVNDSVYIMCGIYDSGETKWGDISYLLIDAESIYAECVD